jgi:hypothetical protein
VCEDTEDVCTAHCKVVDGVPSSPGGCCRAILTLNGVSRGLEHFNGGLMVYYNDRSNTFHIVRRCEIVLHCDPKQIEHIVPTILILEPATY